MTYEQAYAIWKGNSGAAALEFAEMTDLVSKAILKQIPMKPTAVNILIKIETEEMKHEDFECPNCGRRYLGGNYCSRCGQAIDWSEED